MEEHNALPEWAPWPVLMEYAPLDEPIIGRCQHFPLKITIAPWIKDTDDEYLRQATVYHELTHCMAMIPFHSDNPTSIMYYKHVPATMDQWESKLHDLVQFIKNESPLNLVDSPSTP